LDHGVAHAVDHLHHAEHHEGQQDEIDQYGQEVAPRQDNGARLGQGIEGFRAAVAFGQAQDRELIGEIDFAPQYEADDGHDDVLHQRVDDLAERGPDDDTDREVYHVALDCKLPEFVEKTSSLVHMFTFDQVMLCWVTL